MQEISSKPVLKLETRQGCSMQRNLAWYDHFPEAMMTVMENYQVKLQRCFIVDVPCPYFDTRVAEKEKEKIQHVSGLKSGSAIWNSRSVISVIPIDIGAIGTYSSKWYEHSPARVTENEEVKILRDFTIKTYGKSSSYTLRYLATATLKAKRQREKQEKYQALARKISKF
ncbi:unnamed protein product [Porites lobata]|uniref:Uncharacterized protein n=1 Tax=Porites lobata TaxID=104759 RepID=A0ABN8P258_9CNID|nr:unnamed protein product [Porites lobata]